jgi:hypothetical protein
MFLIYINMFGNWIHNIDELHKQFISSGSVKYVTIDNFLTEEWAEKLNQEFPLPELSDAPWKKFDDPVERRYTLWNFKGVQSVVDVVNASHSIQFIKYIERITGFENLLIDPKYEHATGLTALPRNGKLGVHLDVTINKESGTQRRCNLLIYLNKDWKAEYGGALQVGDSPTACKDIIAPSWNTAVILENSPISYHGVPIPLKCPEGEYRKNLAIYYSSLPTDDVEKKYRAKWVIDSSQITTPNLKRIYDIRCNRAITQDDLKDWPTWREDT